MKYIVYGYKNFIYAIPAWDEKELRAAADMAREYGGEFRIVGEFTATADVPSGRKWYGIRQGKGESKPIDTIIRGIFRNRDYL